MMVELVGQSGRDSDNVAANPARLINLYGERTTEGERVLKSVLGMDAHAELDGVFVRAMGRVDGQAYAVCGGRLWRINLDGSTANLGAVDTGPASICGNNGYVCVQAGTRYFVYDTSANTMAEPPAGAFSAMGSVEFFGNYTVLTEAGGRRFQWSALADPTSLPGLNFSTADGKDDNLLRGLALDGRLYLFKEESTEVWYNSGEAGAEAMVRMSGGVYDIGLRSRELICRFEGGAFIVGNDNRAHLVSGGQFQPVSTPPVETAIKLHRPQACLTYSDEGHTFIAIIFKDAPAWVYDIAMGEWSERAEGVDLGPWNVAASCQIGRKWAVGRNNGQISILRRTNSDGALPLVREITSRTLRMDGARTILREFEVYPRQGFSPGTMDLHISRDGGMTWTPPKPKSIGGVGEFGRRAIWRNLGMARVLNARLRWTEPADITLSTMVRIAT